MTDEWRALTDEQLAEVAHQDLQGRGASVEAMRRLRVAMEELSVSSNNSARLMLRFTIVVIFLNSCSSDSCDCLHHSRIPGHQGMVAPGHQGMVPLRTDNCPLAAFSPRFDRRR